MTGGQWLFSGPVHPEALYLPEGCSAFVSMRWGELVRAGATESKVPLPGIAVAERCRVFLRTRIFPRTRLSGSRWAYVLTAARF